jgi:hypothetical protein
MDYQCKDIRHEKKVCGFKNNNPLDNSLSILYIIIGVLMGAEGTNPGFIFGTCIKEFHHKNIRGAWK